MGHQDDQKKFNGKDLFLLAFGINTVAPIEVGLPSFWIEQFKLEKNEDQFRYDLDMLKKKREASQVHVMAYK